MAAFPDISLLVIQYSLMPIMGSLCLGKAAGILVLDMPMLRAKRWILDELQRNSELKFEYSQK